MIESEVIHVVFKESKHIELKERFTKSLLKTVSAFSNFNDGYIYIGVSDQGDILGFPNVHEERIKIENQLNTSITPKPFFDLSILEIDGTFILEIKVYKGEDGPYYYQNVAYMRNDTSTIPLDGPQLTRLILKSKHLTFDQLNLQETHLSFHDLHEHMRDVLQIDDMNEAVLKTLGLFNREGYNNAALLLSDTNSMPHSFVDIATFTHDTNTFTDRKILKNTSIIKQFEHTMTYFKTKYPSIQKIEGPKRTTKEQVPIVAFREALSNALIHRDYFISSGVQIAMFNNRIEINSPGGLPEGINESQYYKGLTSAPRNPILSNVFFRLNIIEQFGTGVKRIIDSYKTYQIKPSFDIQDNQIRIILPVTNFNYTRLNTTDAILSFLKAFPLSSRQSIEETIQMDKSSLLRKLNDLEAHGFISKEGAGPSTKYVAL